MDNRKRKRIDRESLVLLYKAGYSLEDLAIIFKKEDGTPTSKSVMSRILKEQREVLNDPIMRREVIIPPNRMPQSMINILTRAEIFNHVLELYNKKYHKGFAKDTTFKKSPKEFTKDEKRLFLLGKKLYMIHKQGSDIKAFTKNHNITPQTAMQSIKFYKKYVA